MAAIMDRRAGRYWHGPFVVASALRAKAGGAGIRAEKL